MAKEIFIDTHLDFVYSPLNVSYGIAVDGNVAAEQNYDQGDGSYTPDYTKTYCVLKPWMRVVDPDEVIASGAVQMTNMHWYVFDGTAETEITNGTDYQMASDGRLSIRKNLEPGKTLIYRFTGEYQDPRNGDIWKMDDNKAVICGSESARVRLTLNQPELVEWDPTTEEPSKIVLRADLLLGKDPVASANMELIWEKKDEDDADYCRIYREGDADYDYADYDVELSTDGKSLTLKRDLMGHRVDLRARAKYDPYGNPSGKTLTESSPSVEAAFTRNIPAPTVNVLTPTQFPASQKTWQPTLEVFIGDRPIANPERFWHFNWYLSKGVAAGTVTRTLVGEGVKPTLPLSYLAKNFGATLQLGVVERDPLSAIVSDGFILTENGAIILA